MPTRAPVVASGPARVSWLGPKEVKVGEVFAVTLALETADALRGVPLEIAFSAAALDVLDITEGDFFKQSGGQTNFTHAVNISTGRIGVGILRSDNTGSGGKGNLLQLQLRAKTAGSVELTLSSLRPIGFNSVATTAELPALRILVK